MLLLAHFLLELAASSSLEALLLGTLTNLKDSSLLAELEEMEEVLLEETLAYSFR